MKYTTSKGKVKDRSRVYVSYMKLIVRRVALVIRVKPFERPSMLCNVRNSVQILQLLQLENHLTFRSFVV
jgi:hypothetical protein